MKFNKKVIVVLLLLVGILATSSLAYKTDHKARVNSFTVGKVQILLTEPKYNSPHNIEARKDLAPNEKVIKDPKITNIGTSDCFVFLEIFMPRTNRIRIDDTGQKLPKGYRDAFLFTRKNGWIQVEREVVIKPDGKHYYRYVYAYATGDKVSGSMTVLKKGHSTPTFFVNDVLNYRNFIEVEEQITYEIPVFAYAIQTTDLANITGQSTAGKTGPADVWNVIKAQKKAEGVR